MFFFFFYTVGKSSSIGITDNPEENTGCPIGPKQKSPSFTVLLGVELFELIYLRLVPHPAVFLVLSSRVHFQPVISPQFMSYSKKGIFPTHV